MIIALAVAIIVAIGALFVCAKMMDEKAKYEYTLKFTKDHIQYLLKEYEEYLNQKDKMIDLACTRLSKEVYVEELGKYRTVQEWKDELLKNCQ